MAKIGISAVQRKNPRNGQTAWYAQPKTYSLIGADGMKEAVSRNSQIDPSVVSSVMNALATEIKNFVYNGHNIKLDGLGTFAIRYGSLPANAASNLTGEYVKPKTIGFRMGSEIRKACNLKLVQFFRFDVPELYQQNGELAWSYYEDGYYNEPQP